MQVLVHNESNIKIIKTVRIIKSETLKQYICFIIFSNVEADFYSK